MELVTTKRKMYQLSKRQSFRENLQYATWKQQIRRSFINIEWRPFGDIEKDNIDCIQIE